MKRKWLIFKVFCLFIFFVSCNSYDVEGKPEIKSDPEKWVVGFYLNNSELDKDQDNNNLNFRSQEFTIINKGVAGELKIYQINFLSPSGEILSSTNVKDLQPLFSYQISELDKGLVKDGFSDANVKDYKFTNFDASKGDSTIARPLCPLTAKLDAKTGKPIEPTQWVCKTGFETNYNDKLKIKLFYNKLDNDTYKNLAGNTSLKSTGNYSIELCTNDSSREVQKTCSKGTSFRIQVTRQPMLPPQPLLKVKFLNPTGGTKDYRVIKDSVMMDLSDTKVSNPEDALLFEASNDQDSENYKKIRTYDGDQSQFRIKYRWELSQTPTPLAPETRIVLDNISGGGEGQWFEDNSNQNPKLAHFKAHRITPTPEGIYYKVKVQAITVDMNTDLESAITEVVITPNIIPAARVTVELKWKNGLDTKAQLDRKQGTAVDLDLHLIKKKSLEGDSHPAEKGLDGLMCTRHKLKNSTTGTNFHDDCYFNDMGSLKDGKQNEIVETIKWGASLDLDNTWGGGNFTNPETINLGPIDDISPKDGVPDFNIFDDEYLIVVNYTLCQDLAEGSQNKSCLEGGENYEVPVKVDVMIDGVYVPRGKKVDGTTDYADTLHKEFNIRPNEWVIVSKVAWDRTLQGKNSPKWQGDAIVTDNNADYKICNFPKEECFLNTIPVWDKQKYYDFVELVDTAAGYDKARGTCN